MLIKPILYLLVSSLYFKKTIVEQSGSISHKENVRLSSGLVPDERQINLVHSFLLVKRKTTG